MFENDSVVSAQGRIRNALAYSLKEKYGKDDPELVEKILKIHGMAKENFDFIHNLEELISKGVAEASIDQNANKNESTITGLMSEVINPINKIVGYRYLYRKMKELYGKKEAKRLTGEMYDFTLALSDSTKILLPYCLAMDASRIVIEGRPYGQLPSAPPKRLSSYIAALNETVHQMSNHLAGAIGVATFFLDVARVLMFEEGMTNEKLEHSEPRKYIENCFQSFIHSVNHLSRQSNESAFVNVSVFDRVKLEGFLDDDSMGWYFEGKDKEEVIVFILALQDIFMKFFDKGDKLNNGIPYRFPVISINLSKSPEGQILDEEFVEKICQSEIYRYNILVSKGTKTCSCCFRGDQKVMMRISGQEPQLMSFEEMWNLPKKTRIYTSNSGVWRHATPIKIDGKQKLYEVTTSNKKKIVVTANHLHPTWRGDIPTSELTVDDYLMFTNSPLAPVRSTDEGLTFAQGVMVGAYLGDGSNLFSDTNQIVFSMNREKIDALKDYFSSGLADICETREFTTNATGHNCLNYIISSEKVKRFLSRWIKGNLAHNKEIDMVCLAQSIEFRKGIIHGFYATDGGNSNRMYTCSPALAESLEAILTSLGVPSIIDISDRTDENVIIRGEEFNRNYPLYCVRFYSGMIKEKYGDVYKKKQNSIFFRVTEIKEVESVDEVYCFEMKNQDNPYFDLPNGIITHNCRLLSDSEMMESAGLVNSFGGSAISMGSTRVVTIDFNRLALESLETEEYLTKVKKSATDAAKILKAHKELINDTEKQGLQPFITNQYIKMQNMFCTVGIMGIVEASKVMEGKADTGIDYIGTTLKNLELHCKELSKEYGIVINIEQIPGESMAVKLSQVDNILFDTQYAMYSNQFIPLWEDATIWERMTIDGKYNSMVSGGAIVHFSLGERITPQQAKKLIYFACESGSEHFALNSVYSRCENKHTHFGNFNVCPECGAEIVEKYTRVVGFFTPVSSWNKTRREWEFPQRSFGGIE